MTGTELDRQIKAGHGFGRILATYRLCEAGVVNAAWQGGVKGEDPSCPYNLER